MIQHHNDMEQGSDAWLANRLGLLTASEIKKIISPKKLEPVQDPAHLYEILSQRITGFIEPMYINDDMLRGMVDEVEARDLYSRHYSPVTQCGFITNDKFGFKIGYSPDGLVGDDGLVECKSRRQKFQIETILENKMPDDFKIQVQTGLLVSERKWCDFISFCGGLPMVTIRIFPDPVVQEAIVEAATVFEKLIAEKMDLYKSLRAERPRLIPTQRRVVNEGEITL